MLSIEPDHPHAREPLLTRLADVLARDGADVIVGHAANNTVRPRRDVDPGELPWIIEAEGLPNLLHEFLHYLQAGRLAEDHGIDYSLIPLNTAVPTQRLLLWQELACCTVSCAYLADRPARVQPWFDEQLGILHHFYGYEDAAPFLAHVGALVERHRPELEATLAEAYRLAAERLGPPPRCLEFGQLWGSMHTS